MNITKLRVNHVDSPLGFNLDHCVFSYVVKNGAGDNAKFQKSARIVIALDEQLENIVFDTGMSEDIDSIAYILPEDVILTPATKYYWRVTVAADTGIQIDSAIASFETAPVMSELKGDFITSETESDVCEFYKSISITKPVKKARAYATALGIFELHINGEKVSNEYLTPYTNDYETWQQVITFDMTDKLASAAQAAADTAEISMIVAPGWYCGFFGFAEQNHIYGDKLAAFVNLAIEYEDGTTETVCTDTSWSARQCQVRYAEIYHGEVYDRTFKSDEIYKTITVDFDKAKLSARRSLPVIVKEVIKPKRIITTPAGETVIDLGQNMVGWMSFKDHEEAGTKIYIQYGEILQDGNFYRDNLRTAKAEFTYISDGNGVTVRPHLTYYGFRYAKVCGLTKEYSVDDFAGEVIYSDMDIIGHVETGNSLVNRLFLNALWGQKGNFVDVPTDCPQRDERLGWTGDAQVFSGTALFNMDCAAFYSKYGYDMLMEQNKRGGMVPMVVPACGLDGGGSSAWADAATVIAWNAYVYTGDKAILKQQYPSMKGWTDFIHKQDVESGDTGLWQVGFHFGDWLALDNVDPKLPTGATEQFFVASSYYFMSAKLTAKAAAVLGFTEDAAYYEAMADKTRTAIKDEYFTANGRLAIATQTGYIIALAFGFCPDEFKDRVANDLNAKITKDGEKLMTGFVGTPYICKMLSEHGYNELAYKLLLNEDCPGWLYPVRMGATTIWERWDSIMPDGKINPEGMNSMNHYSYGAVAEWMYRYMGGINPLEDKPGFREIVLKPMPDYRMSNARVSYDSPIGKYESFWKITGDMLEFSFEIPFGGKAYVTLPNAPETVTVNGTELKSEGLTLDAGSHEISYIPTVSYVRCYSSKMNVRDLFKNPAVKAKLLEIIPALEHVPFNFIGDAPLIDAAFDAMLPVSMDDVNKADEALKEFFVQPDAVPEMIMDI